MKLTIKEEVAILRSWNEAYIRTMEDLRAELKRLRVCTVLWGKSWTHVYLHKSQYSTVRYV